MLLEIDDLVLAVLSTSRYEQCHSAWRNAPRGRAKLEQATAAREADNLAPGSEIGNPIRDSSQSSYRARIHHPQGRAEASHARWETSWR